MSDLRCGASACATWAPHGRVGRPRTDLGAPHCDAALWEEGGSRAGNVARARRVCSAPVVLRTRGSRNADPSKSYLGPDATQTYSYDNRTAKRSLARIESGRK